MPFRGRRINWYEKQKKRKASPFFRLLDRSFRFRLLLAGLMSLAILGAVNRFETCRLRNHRSDCLGYEMWSIISVSNIESFSIVTAALLYILESKQRKQEKHGKAAERLTISQQIGAVNSLSRIEALETLSEDGLWLDGIDLQGANLEGLSVPYGRLRGANLSRTLLIGANLQETDLTGADLTGADLTGANLAGADLTGANLAGANLTDADLSGTILDGKLPLS
jgi:hypothetical protein